MSNPTDHLKSLNTFNKFKVLLKDSVVFGGLNALSKFFSLFLTPVFTTLLSKPEYGTMDILNPILTISGTIIILGMDSAVARFYYQAEDTKEKNQIISNGFWTQVVASLIVVTFIVSFKTVILNYYLGQYYKPSQDTYLMVIAGVILLSTPIRFVQNLLIWTYEKKRYALLTSGFIVGNFVSILCALYIIPDKLLGVFIGQLIPGLFFALLSIFFVKEHLLFNVDWKLLGKMAKFGAPLVLLAFIPALIPALDRSFINKYSGLEEVANYGIGYRIATLIALPISSLSTALGPFILGLYKEKNAERLFNTVSYGIILLVSSAIVILITVSPLLIKVLASVNYLPGMVVVAPLSFYFLLDMLRSISASGIDLSMKTYWNLVLYPIGLSILYVLLSLLTPTYGIMGAGLALFITAFANFNIFTFVGRRLYPFSYNQFKMSLTILVAFTMSFILGVHYEDDYFYLYGVSMLVAFFIFGFVIFIDKDQRRVLKEVFLSKLLKR